MDENKKEICFLLEQTLKKTRDGSNIGSISFEESKNEKTEIAIITSINGSKKIINVTGDSGIAMIKDIISQL